MSGELVKASCDPSKLSNYFQPSSNHPHELSPAFCCAGVLSKYKADRQKYTLNKRQIICRGTWRLRSYDVNEAGQIHAYLVDLNKLPSEEQLHWKAHNEWPKGSLSTRAILNDFQGKADRRYDPLHSLGARVSGLDRHPPDWWQPRPKRLHQILNAPPVTDSVDEWADAILDLDQLVVEGLVARALTTRLDRQQRRFERQWGSLKLAEECLIGYGISSDDAKSAVAPFREVHMLRNTLRGHAATKNQSQRSQGGAQGARIIPASFQILGAWL